LQHQFTTKCLDNNLVLPAIPTAQLHHVADIACGTGIWLKELSERLSPKAEDGVERTYTGFDISSAMFPPTDEGGPTKFVAQDILAPVPEEYIEKFDLLHIKMLCFAIKIVDYPIMMENLVKMISESFVPLGIHLPKSQPLKNDANRTRRLLADA
jgi:predicted TPR repeat methyltransferase